jgi:hypothetical protein
VDENNVRVQTGNPRNISLLRMRKRTVLSMMSRIEIAASLSSLVDADASYSFRAFLSLYEHQHVRLRGTHHRVTICNTPGKSLQSIEVSEREADR